MTVKRHTNDPLAGSGMRPELERRPESVVELRPESERDPSSESVAESAPGSIVDSKSYSPIDSAIGPLVDPKERPAGGASVRSADRFSDRSEGRLAERPAGGVERHPFEPFLPAGAKVLILGSFPPQRKRWCLEFYYPNWLNDFWRICGIVFYEDSGYFVIPGKKVFDVQKVKAFCSEKGIAMFDTATEVRRLNDNASDKFLEVVTPTDIPALLAQIPDCRAVVTTGQKATDVLLAACRPADTGMPRAGESVDGGTSFDGTSADGSLSSAAPAGFDAKAGIGAPAGIAAPPVGGCVPAVIAGRAVDFWRMPSTSRAYPLPLNRKADAYRHLFATIGLL